MLLAPGAILPLLLSNRTYDETFVRFSGGLMLALGMIVIQVIRLRAEALYPMTLVVRPMLWLVALWLCIKSEDPMFLVVLFVVGLGMVLTGVSYWRDRRAV